MKRHYEDSKPSNISICNAIDNINDNLNNKTINQDITSNKKNDRKVLKIAIIGGGLSGLATVVALQNHPNYDENYVKIQIYEKDIAFNDRKQGYGLTLTNNQKGALEKLGITQDCIEMNCISTCHYIFDKQGYVLGYYGRQFKNTQETQSISKDSSFNLRIPRQDMRKILLDKIKCTNINWGYKLVNYEQKKNTLNQEDIIEIKLTNTITNDIIIENVDVLVGCDGIHSVVRTNFHPSISPLKYVGVCVILGLSTFQCPLVNNRGFYVLDGINRLFIMPFRKKDNLTMWQLSFSGMSEEEGLKLKTQQPELILQEALKRVSNWFKDVSNIFEETSLKEVWMTPLYDRDPLPLRKRDSRVNSCVCVLGDSAHPMSMFKGQGANQAMEDGPLFASWLLREPNITNQKQLETRLRCFEREMVSRTSPKVLSSRDAAKYLHSSEVVNEFFGIEGIKDKDIVTTILQSLRDRNIKVNMTNNDTIALDDRVREVLNEVLQRE